MLRALLSSNRSACLRRHWPICPVFLSPGWSPGLRCQFARLGVCRSLRQGRHARVAAAGLSVPPIGRSGGAWDRCPLGRRSRLSRVMIERVIAACEVAGGREHWGALNGLMALLRRLQAEAAREEAREEAGRLVELGSPRQIVINLAAIEAELATAA